MTSRHVVSLATALLSLALAGPAIAADTAYGSQLMTPQERAEHRAALRGARTAAERDAYRQQHHDAMQARARERGVQLPDTPPAQGGGGNRRADGAGMGPRGGR